MKCAAALALASLLLSPGLFAQSVAPSTTVLPPPGINDPGVTPVAPATNAAKDSASTPATLTPDTRIGRPLPAIQDDSTADGTGKHMNLPDVSVRQEGDEQVQEFSHSGIVYQIVVTPKHGVQQIYNVDPDGTRHLRSEPAVQPVMYKVFEWGKSKPAEDSSTATPDDGG